MMIDERVRDFEWENCINDIYALIVFFLDINDGTCRMRSNMFLYFSTYLCNDKVESQAKRGYALIIGLSSPVPPYICYYQLRNGADTRCWSHEIPTKLCCRGFEAGAVHNPTTKYIEGSLSRVASYRGPR